MAIRETLNLLLERRGHRVELDPEWPSPCAVGEPDANGMVEWRPVPMLAPPDLSGVAQLLRQPVHPEAAEFFGSFFAGPVESKHSGELVLLRTFWNQQEVDQLEADLLDHLRGQLEEGLRPNLPVAVSSADLFFAVDNVT